MKKIIVPVDFSGNSDKAARTAGTIAKQTGAKVVLTHWYGKPYSVNFESMTTTAHATLNASENDSYKEEVSAKMDELLGKPELKGVEHSKLLIFGTDVEDVMEMDVLKDADLFVIGKTGTSELEETFVGSTASDVIRYAKAPVLTVDEYTDVFSS